MNISDSRYSVGALLYCPALNDKIALSVLRGQFGVNYSLALCLEDSIADSAVEKALNQLENTFKELSAHAPSAAVPLPKIFVRVRNPEQIQEVYEKIRPFSDIFTGFIFPKYSLETAPIYNREFQKVLATIGKRIYMMPVLESRDLISYSTRCATLLSLKEHIDQMRDHVLNIRVGGNDFSNAFGLRRHIDEVIYDILPIAQLLCDILTVFSMDYVVSGPVWEYYSGEDHLWAEGLKRELKYDLLNGFIGKTVIHPNQIPIVTQALKVDKQDYEDALQILNWDNSQGALVAGSATGTRMNEVKTHRNWALRIVTLAGIYGIRDSSESS